MSKWSDEQAIKAYDELRELGRYGLGRAILDLRERAEKAEARVAEVEQHAIRLDMHVAEQAVRAMKAERRCAALEALARRFGVASSRAGLLLARSNQALDAPESSVAAELAIREVQEDVEAALSGDESALNEMLERAAKMGGQAGWDADHMAKGDVTPQQYWESQAADIAKRVLREGR